MNTTRWIRFAARGLMAAVGAAAAYATFVGITWSRYGHVPRPVSSDEEDELLDRFMPAYEVVERHHVRVAAPAAVTLAAAREMDLLQSPVVRAIIKGRELILGAMPDNHHRPRGLLAELLSLGWGVLAEVPGREIVVSSVTKPWEPNPTFRALAPAEFEAFREPDYVKIVWTLRADHVGENESTFRTETRAMATDAASRTKFRRYWSFVSPGIWMIRRVSLLVLKAEAERRSRAGRSESRVATPQLPGTL